MIEFRNSVAHGRTAVVVFDDVLISGEHAIPDRPSSSIEQACTIKTASDVAQDARAMIETLGTAAGSNVSPLLIATHTDWVTKPTDIGGA